MGPVLRPLAQRLTQKSRRERSEPLRQFELRLPSTCCREPTRCAYRSDVRSIGGGRVLFLYG